MYIFAVHFVKTLMIFFAPLRLYQGIDKPLNVLTAENTKLIQMQSNSVAATPTKWACLF